MQIIYVHHGHRAKGFPRSQDEGLTEIGQKDTELVAELLKDLKGKSNPKAIYTSQFFRCTKTAENINKHLSLPIIVDTRLDEFESIKGETWTDLLNRVIESLKDIIKKHDNNDTVIVVTSGVNLSAFICLNFGLTPSENIPMLAVPSCSPIGFNFDKEKFI